MRLGLVIVCLTGIAVALVHVRRAEISARHATQRLRMRQVKFRLSLWDQQNRLSFLTSPEEVRRRAKEMKLDLIPPGGGDSLEPAQPDRLARHPRH